MIKLHETGVLLAAWAQANGLEPYYIISEDERFAWIGFRPIGKAEG